MGVQIADNLSGGWGTAERFPDDREPPPDDNHADHLDHADDAPPRTLEDALVVDELRKLRARARARELFDAERAPKGEPFDAGTLADILARPAEPQARVEGLIPWAASALIVAQRKAGKTTLTLNLARCLLTGEPFLGSLAVRPVNTGARVALLNYEVTGAQLARWAEDAGVPVDRLFLVNLRGRRNPLTHPADRDALAALLREQRVESLIVDPFGRAYSGASQNDAGEVGSWLVGLDQFARSEVGALDVILTAHAGWNGERTRGSSALEDWADVIVTMTRDDDTGDRFLRATGRDVELDEDRIDFNPATRTLTLSGAGSRKTSAAGRRDAETVAAILDALTRHPDGLSGERLREETHRQDAALTSVRNALVKAGTLEASGRPGRGGGTVYKVANPEPREPRENPLGRDLPNPANPPCSWGGSEEAMLEPNPASTGTGRVCADCDGPVAAGHVRCPECQRNMFRGVR